MKVSNADFFKVTPKTTQYGLVPLVGLILGFAWIIQTKRVMFTTKMLSFVTITFLRHSRMKMRQSYAQVRCPMLTGCLSLHSSDKLTLVTSKEAYLILVLFNSVLHQL